MQVIKYDAPQFDYAPPIEAFYVHFWAKCFFDGSFAMFACVPQTDPIECELFDQSFVEVCQIELFPLNSAAIACEWDKHMVFIYV